MKKTLLFLALSLSALAAWAFPPARDYYAIRIYRFSSPSQESDTESFLKAAYLPALHRAGIAKVGVFKPIETDTASFGKKLYLLIPLKSLEEYGGLDDKLAKDAAFQSAGAAYLTAPYTNPPYSRMETILCKSFSGMPRFSVPALNGPVNTRIYELRSYEGYTEKIFANKVQMFNAGDEIGLFNRLGFNAVFYSEVVSGAHMPNLMYMTSFDNMTTHDAHWKAFVDDPQWKKLSTMPEYQHNVSHIDIYLLHPTDYSDI